MMVAVALVAVLIEGELTRRRIVEYRDRAEAHAEVETRLRGDVEREPALTKAFTENFEARVNLSRKEYLENSLKGINEEISKMRAKHKEHVISLEEEARKDRAFMEWHSQMKKIYNHAMWHPWEDLGPLPLPPEPVP